MIVLDTHAFLWWIDDPERLSDVAREALDAEATLGVASISCWELATLSIRGRLDLDRPPARWIAQALGHPRISELALTSKIAVAAALLDQEGFHPDPADRVIYATARSAGVPLVSADQAIQGFDPTRTIW